jgi:alpha-ribazole phosphatase/probable phosphoglycerate mutase
MATRVFVARHGETVDNAGERWQGWSDSPLTPRGRAQAQALARRLASEPLAAAYSSDLGRALETARIACSPHGLEPQPLPALRERDVGLFSGLTGAEVATRYPGAMESRATLGVLDWAPPEGESFRQMLDRILPAIDEIAAAWDGHTVLVVTHGGVVRLLVAHSLGADWESVYTRHPSNCGLSLFRWVPDSGLEVEQFDACEHLSEGGVAPLSEDAAS